MDYTELIKWQNIGKYNSGKADVIGHILGLFNEKLDPEIKEWLHKEREARRNEAINAYDNAVLAVNREKENV